MSRWTTLLAIALLSVIIAMGCSAGKGNPVLPAGSGLTANSASSGNNAQTHLWGYYDIYIDVASKTATAVPNRDLMFAANVVTFLNGNPASLTFPFLNIFNDPGGVYIDVDIDVALTHPFAGMPQYDGYDVRGIFVGNGSKTLGYNAKLKYATIGGLDQEMRDYNLTTGDIHTVLAGNPDGYTRWWNEPEFTTPGVLGFTNGKLATKGYVSTATLNPYKYFADGLGIEDDAFTFLTGPGLAGNGVFTNGTTNTRNYYLRFPIPVPNVAFQYAVLASWKGELPEDHPANTTEAPIINAVVNPSLWFVDGTSKGGNLDLTIDVYQWPLNSTVGPEAFQPSAIWVESSVLTAPVQVTDPAAPSGAANCSTYTLDVPADNLVSGSGQDFWVICEYGASDYKNEYGVTNLAGDDKLAAFFRYDLPISPTPYCTTEVLAISPPSGQKNTSVVATILCSELEDGPSLAAKLTKTGQPDIVGTAVTFVDTTHVQATFDLTNADKGKWDVSVTNGCGGTPGVGLALFEVTGGWIIEKTGPLPTPQPTSTFAFFDVQADTTMAANAGVFYNYTTGSNYLYYKYPLDYSTNGTLYKTLSHWMGMAAMFGTPAFMSSFEITPTGIMTGHSNWTNTIYSIFTANEIPWWGTAAGAFQIGLLPWNNSFSDGGPFIDWDKGYGLTSDVWGFWGNPTHDGLYFGDQFKLSSPFGTYNYTEFVGYVPYDTVGGTDGYVDDTNVKKMALDDAPQGLDPSFDIIFYYLEGAPATPAIECIANNKSLALPNALATIKTFAGVPVDVTTFNGYYTGGPAASNWVVALEQIGSTWTIESWNQTGTLVASMGAPVNGTPIAIDLDCKNHKLHVWFNDGGLKYAILIFA